MLKPPWISMALSGLVTMSASAQQQMQRPPAAAQAYAPIQWLIGDWLSDANGNRIRQTFRWGPKQSYILYSTYTSTNGNPEALHFEGILVWNANAMAYDYVFAIEPGSGGQEKGSMRAEADGSIVREVELTAADGGVGRFRQSFRRTGPDTAVTSLFRQNASGWEPNFPGSDRIEMKRRVG